MRPVILLVGALVVSFVAAGLLLSPERSQTLEIVPPDPSFGVENRVADVDVVPRPYGPDRLSLRQLAAEAGILIGAAVEPEEMVAEAEYNPLIAREFSIVTPENPLKFGLVRRKPNRYTFESADMIVDFAAQNDQRVRGHTLVWHEELPDWLRVEGMSGEELADLLKEHIETLVGRYAGTIQYWDVLNEAIDWDGTLRQTLWLEKLGPEYIDQVFWWAHAADPEAMLFYNDYDAEDLGAKADGVYELVKGMLARGVPLHGVGFQGHFDIEEPPDPEEVAANIERLAELGLEVQFTEVDVKIPVPVTAEKLEEQADVYWSMLNVCVESPACTTFVTWGVTDKFSWIPVHRPGYDAGLMFDEEYEPKPAYWALRDVLERKLGAGPYAQD